MLNNYYTLRPASFFFYWLIKKERKTNSDTRLIEIAKSWIKFSSPVFWQNVTCQISQ